MDTVVSPEKVEVDLATRRNSIYIHWKRPGQRSRAILALFVLKLACAFIE